MTFLVDGIEKHISLKKWSNETQAFCYHGEDIFAGVAGDDIIQDPAFEWVREEGAWVCSKAAYDRLVEFWREETSKYNVWEPNYFTDGLDEEELMEELNMNLEYIFDYD